MRSNYNKFVLSIFFLRLQTPEVKRHLVPLLIKHARIHEVRRKDVVEPPFFAAGGHIKSALLSEAGLGESWFELGLLLDDLQGLGCQVCQHLAGDHGRVHRRVTEAHESRRKTCLRHKHVLERVTEAAQGSKGHTKLALEDRRHIRGTLIEAFVHQAWALVLEGIEAV